MSINIPQNTKIYLTAMLENKIESIGAEKLFNNIEGYKQKYLTQNLHEQEATTSGLMTGYEGGPQTFGDKLKQKKKERQEKEEKQKNLDALQKEAETGGFGSTTDPNKKMKSPSASEIMFGDMSGGDIAAAAGLYGGGMFGKWLQKMAGSNSILGQLGGQIEDLTGKSWFDTQVANISKGQLGLVAQGAGSPWVPFYMPGRSKVKSQKERQDDETDELIRQRKRRDEAQKYGIPYP